MIVQLLLKDLRIQKRFILASIVFLGIVIFSLGAFEGIPLALPAAIFTHFLTSMAGKMDERNQNGLFLNSLPICRRDVVTAKYISLFMFMGIGLISITVLRIASGFIFPIEELPWFTLESALITLIGLLVFYAIYFPLFFSFGSKIGQILDLIIIVTVGGLFVLTSRILEWFGYDFGQMLQKLSQISKNQVMISAVVISVVLLIFSWLISAAVYRKRNL